jgi:hypothetical protein
MKPTNTVDRKILIFSGGMCLFLIILVGVIIYIFSQLSWNKQPTVNTISVTQPVVSGTVIATAIPTLIPTEQLSAAGQYVQYLQTQNLCTKEKTSLTAEVNRFETLQMQRDPAILALFTPPDPNNSGEVSDYTYFAGTDIGSPRLYNNVETNFKETGYTIKGNKENDTCVLLVDEIRSFYQMPANNNPPLWTTPKSFTTEIWLTKTSKGWQVEDYSVPSGNNLPGKYSAFNQL